MTRYHFNVHDGAACTDQDGIELPDLAAARLTAARRASDLLRLQQEPFWDGCELRVEVTDDNGLLLFSMLFMAFDPPVPQGRF